MSHVNWHDFEQVRLGDMPEPVMTNFFNGILPHAQTAYNDDTLVSISRLDWERTTVQELKDFQEVASRNGRQFEPTLVRFRQSLDSDEGYCVMVDFGSGMVMHEGVINNGEDLLRIFNEILYDMETGRAVAQSLLN